MYVRNTHTHMHPAIGTFHYTCSLHASPCRLLGLLGYTIFGATTYRLSMYSTAALLHLHLVLLSFLPYLLPPNSTLHLPYTKGNPELYPSKHLTVRRTRSKNLSHPSLGIAALLGLPYLPSYLPPTYMYLITCLLYSTSSSRRTRFPTFVFPLNLKSELSIAERNG